MAAIAGVDPGPMTFGELSYACEAKIEFEWGRQASLMAHIGNRAIDIAACLNKDAARRRPFKPEDFYRPRLHKAQRRRVTDSVSQLRALKPLFRKG